MPAFEPPLGGMSESTSNAAGPRDVMKIIVRGSTGSISPMRLSLASRPFERMVTSFLMRESGKSHSVKTDPGSGTAFPLGYEFSV